MFGKLLRSPGEGVLGKAPSGLLPGVVGGLAGKMGRPVKVSIGSPRIGSIGNPVFASIERAAPVWGLR